MLPTLHSICNNPNAGQTLLVVTAEDLREFALDVARAVMQQNEPQYFTRKELLKYLGVCARTLWAYEDEGEPKEVQYQQAHKSLSVSRIETIT